MSNRYKDMPGVDDKRNAVTYRVLRSRMEAAGAHTGRILEMRDHLAQTLLNPDDVKRKEIPEGNAPKGELDSIPGLVLSKYYGLIPMTKPAPMSCVSRIKNRLEPD